MTSCGALTARAGGVRVWQNLMGNGGQQAKRLPIQSLAAELTHEAVVGGDQHHGGEVEGRGAPTQVGVRRPPEVRACRPRRLSSVQVFHTVDAETGTPDESVAWGRASNTACSGFRSRALRSDAIAILSSRRHHDLVRSVDRPRWRVRVWQNLMGNGGQQAKRLPIQSLAAELTHEAVVGGDQHHGAKSRDEVLRLRWVYVVLLKCESRRPDTSPTSAPRARRGAVLRGAGGATP